MTRNIFLIAVSFCVLSAFAQKVTVEGHLTDNEKTDLVAATVRCYADDSVFVIGTTTSSKGEFKITVEQKDGIKLKLVFSYLGYKDMTMNLNPTKETQIRLGDVIMNKEYVQVQEVTVLGSNKVRTEDKMIIYPTKEELRHAYDGYTALTAMMIPGLESNNGKVSYLNQSVLLLINGREATAEEVRDLNAKDIKRVDFYSMGRPDHPEALTVLDYIMKESDYDGTAVLNVIQQINKPAGNETGTVQYFKGKSEFSISVNNRYKNHFKQCDEGNTTTMYKFPDNVIIRTETFLPSLNDGGIQKAYLNYIYRDTKQDFYASLRFNRDAEEADNWGNTIYNIDQATYLKQEYSQSQQINPALQLRYSRNMPSNQRIRVELYGSYGNNDYDRWYEYRKDETVTDYYRNRTDEESYYTRANVNYTKTFRNKSSLNLDLTQDYTRTDDHNLRGGATGDVELNKSNTKIFATYNYKIKNKLNLQVRLGSHVAHTSTGSTNVTNLFFTPYIKLSYMYKRHSFSLSGTANSVEASNANRTGDEYKINEYETFIGNPDLKDYMKYNAALSYTWNMSNNFTLMSYAQFTLNSNSVYQQIRYDNERNTFINKYTNNGTTWIQHYEAAMQYNIIPQILFLRAGLLYTGTKANVWRTIYNNNLYATAAIVYQHKGLQVIASWLSENKEIALINGYKEKVPNWLTLGFQYNWSNWYVTLAYRNPFKATTKGNLELSKYVIHSSSRISGVSDNFIGIKAGCRFNFGKKKHKFEDMEVEDVNQTTIYKDSKSGK